MSVCGAVQNGGGNDAPWPHCWVVADQRWGDKVAGDVVSMGLVVTRCQHYIIACQCSHGVRGVALVKVVGIVTCRAVRRA